MHLTNVYDIVIFAVRDNQIANRIWLRGQAVKTLASHAGIRGSIPLGVTEKSDCSDFFFAPATSQSPGLPETLATAYNPGMCLRRKQSEKRGNVR